MKKKNVIFAGHDLKFAKLIMDYLKGLGKYEIKIDQWTGHNTHNEEHSQECLQWADIIVCEWGLGNAVWYSENKLPHQKLIVRMHRQELDTIYPKQFVLENIDTIIAISPYVYEEFYRTFKLPREKMKMIYNTLHAEQLDRPKEEVSYNLGIIGMCPKMKRLDLAVDMLEKLWQQDSRYKLFVKGKMPQEYPWLWKKEEEREYYEELFQRIEAAPWKDAIIFDGFGPVDEWFQKIGFVLSTSDFESFHLAPSEGMASGSYPIILKWDGSDTIYPPSYLQDDIDSCVSRIIEINSMDSSESLRRDAKQYVQSRFDIKKVGAHWDHIMEELIKN
ncbi:glycosyltransferase [Bacillus sp. DX1.1]|uniref:glycosyltransferase n=1 Tax=unclassified Bacillus (in: firmicutes) TaxID=185979 RepID=UPI002570849D|nr:MULTISPECIES: glycosyltransferase [unclassified Bacillus (in: firmicutes)]MDM5157388.1 glycosyltransferase [Bacillus sp. DX1.1]WJE81613.1 glycosyltransferase [Bacillus sp. DX3.1]